MAMSKRATVIALPLELIDHILAVLPWPQTSIHCYLVSKSLNPIAERF